MKINKSDNIVIEIVIAKPQPSLIKGFTSFCQLGRAGRETNPQQLYLLPKLMQFVTSDETSDLYLDLQSSSKVINTEVSSFSQCVLSDCTSSHTWCCIIWISIH